MEKHTAQMEEKSGGKDIGTFKTEVDGTVAEWQWEFGSRFDGKPSGYSARWVDR